MPEVCEIGVLDFRALFEGPADLVTAIQALRPPWLAGGASGVSTRFRVSVDPAKPDMYQVEQDGLPLGGPRRCDQILAHLDRAISAAAVAFLGRRHLLLHAGAVAYQGRGCMLPAPSGSGKTTLVAGLVASGFEYFSDEVAVIERDTGLLWPFPKPLGIKSGSRRVLTPTYPALRSTLPRQHIDGRALWQVLPPLAARPTRAVPLCAVVLPQYVPRSRTLLAPISASEVLPDVLTQVPDPSEQAGRDLRAVIRMLGSAHCYRLTIGRLDVAVAQVKQTLANIGHARASAG
jgi:hypothetical protein